MRWIPCMMAVWFITWVPARALACSCLGPGITLPAFGATGVPVNTGIWVFSPQDAQLALMVAASGEGVALECVNLGHTTRCNPTADLLPDTLYRDGVTGMEFTTGSTRDDAAPAPPAELDRRYYSSNGAVYGDSCSSTNPSGVVVLTLRGGEPILVVDTSGGTDPAAPSGPVTELFAPSGLARSNEAWIGTWACTNNRPTVPGDRFPLRIGAFDVAGNFSGWVPLKEGAIPYAPPGCSSSTADGTLAAMVLLAVLSLTRKRGWVRPVSKGRLHPIHAKDGHPFADHAALHERE